MTARTGLLLSVCILAGTLSGAAQPGRSIFAGHHKEGERMIYLMKGTNGNWRYQGQASGVVKRDSKGNQVVEYTWSHFVSNGTSVTLPPSDPQFRQIISLDQSNPYCPI